MLVAMLTLSCLVVGEVQFCIQRSWGRLIAGYRVVSIPRAESLITTFALQYGHIPFFNG